MSETQLPPSAKFVRDVLERDGPQTRQELQERTDLPERTLDDALRTLDNRGLLHRDRKHNDLRVVVCEIREDADV